MITRQQQRELQINKLIIKQKQKSSQSSTDTTPSSELQENSLLEMLEFLYVGNKQSVEKDDQESSQDPQIKRIEDYNKQYYNDNLHNLIDDQNVFSQCLANHRIREWARGKMIDWMIEVFASNNNEYSNNDLTFFRAVSLLDAYLRSSYNLNESDMYLIGVTCILIASKIEDIYQLSIKTIIQDLSHNNFSLFQIKQQESIILETLNFDTCFPTVNDYLQYLCFQLFGQSKNQAFQIIQETALYTLKMCQHDYGIIQYQQYLLAASVIGFTILNYVELHFQQLPINFKKQLLQTHTLLRIGQLELADYVECIQKVEELTQTFHSKYPEYLNLQRFN
ncbi:unnamed protein product (macronuclear) [Paramecium tetraurelia]|uniref:Cyclin-like domain-containing protein n=1 Tax=Paramecium tetraurelia TaxID=5888 RepID=A0E779_PARTE|nr:uncharacterized protein GSPATT00023874001 [Paramecium tetraurelia]CAK91146.1 unnamed protein product [Paramecium tetraurelia]|eukprot:XP_001458543.1 hypothetical protein (macronuclear) [Paramecium tetraurelia strain d4-2]